MKTRALSLLILSSLFLTALVALGGCQSQNQTGEIDEMPMERRIGIIKSLGGVKTSNQGTHLLQLDDGDTILLKSLQINLDDEEYSGMTVEVRGALLYTTDGKQIMQVMNIDVLEEATSQQVAAPSWKDHVSTALGFSIKYSDDLTLNTEDGVVFERVLEDEDKKEVAEGDAIEAEEETKTEVEEKHSMTITREKIEADESIISKIGLKGETSADLLAAGMTKSKIGSQSLDAYKKMDGSEVTYFIGDTEWLYTLQIDTGNDKKTLDDQNLFYEMLSTFRLLDKDETTKRDEADVLNNLEIVEGEKMKITKTTEESDEKSATEETETPVKTTTTQDPDTSVSSDAETTQQATEEVELEETASSYSLLESETFKFGMQYPKSWYYAGSAGGEAGVVRHYDFGAKPIEEEPGTVNFDVMSGTVPSGTSVSIGGKSATKVSSGGSVEIYVKGEGSRFYRLSGPSSYESTLLQMAGTIEDK